MATTGAATTALETVVEGYRVLMAFQESFEPPAGVGTKEFMRACLDVMNAYPPTVGERFEVVLGEVDGWQRRAEVTRPSGVGTPPVIVFFHGGAWAMGNPATHRRLASDLSLSGCAVVSLDYRRLPRHRFPAQIEDALFATEWVRAHGAEYGWDGDRVVLAGDSAGATMAAVAAQTLGGEASGPELLAVLLWYGIFDYHEALDLLHPTVLRAAQESGHGYLTSTDAERLRRDPRVSPLYGCSRLPPTYLSVGANDPLLPQSRAMAAALGEHGVPHELHIVPDAPHGFMQLPFLGGYLAGQFSVRDFLLRYAGSASR